MAINTPTAKFLTSANVATPALAIADINAQIATFYADAGGTIWNVATMNGVPPIQNSGMNATYNGTALEYTAWVFVSYYAGS